MTYTDDAEDFRQNIPTRELIGTVNDRGELYEWLSEVEDTLIKVKAFLQYLPDDPGLRRRRVDYLVHCERAQKNIKRRLSALFREAGEERQ